VTLRDVVSRVTPLGVRLWDSVTARAVTEGILMREIGRGIPAFANAAGVMVAADLPGLREAEFGAGDDAYWATPPARRVFTFEVVDALGRFLDFRFTATAPHRGLFTPDGVPSASPGAQAGSIPLFSAPSRDVPSGAAVVRAELHDCFNDRPAAWALLEVTPPVGPPVRGLADRLGRTAVILPYPEPIPAVTHSPLSGQRSLSMQTWPLSLAVRYGPVLTSQPPPDPAEGPPPDLATVLGQPPATLLASLSPLAPYTTATLEFGRELVVRSTGLPTLLVAPEH
jgi:hypothetical protein